MKHFNSGIDLDGICWSCTIRNYKTCGKCKNLLKIKKKPNTKPLVNMLDWVVFKKIWNSTPRPNYIPKGRRIIL